MIGADVASALRAGTDPWVVVGAIGDATIGGLVPLDRATMHHLQRVRRRHHGSGVVAADGLGTVVAGRLTDGGVEVEVVATADAPRPVLRIVQGLAKRSRHDEVVRMLTELGVDRITAVTTTRCQVDLAHKVDRVHERWAAIVDSACSQSRRAHRPVVEGPMTLSEALPGRLDRVLVADPGATTNPLDALQERRSTPDAGASDTDTEIWTAVIGPEGGLTEAEVAGLVDRGAVAVGLGPSVLRTEHAGLALGAVMAAGLGRM